LQWCTRWTQRIEKTFESSLTDEDLFVRFDYTHFLKADLMTRVQAGRVAIMSGMLKPKEWRDSEDLPSDETCDILLQPANMVPLGTPPAQGKGPGSDTTGSGADGGAGDPGKLPSLGDVGGGETE
jgi:hypothetical protein